MGDHSDDAIDNLLDCDEIYINHIGNGEFQNDEGDPYQPVFGFSPRNPLNKKSCGPGKCPKCGAETVKRTNHPTGSLFYGCSKFPKCKGSRNE